MCEHPIEREKRWKDQAPTARAGAPSAWRDWPRGRVLCSGGRRRPGTSWPPERPILVTPERAGAQKTPPPRSGDERCQARGTTPLRGQRVAVRLLPHGAYTRCGDSLTGAGSPWRAPAAAYCGAIGAGSERSSEVLFAGVPGPASQQPRFSGPLPPDTCPRLGFDLNLCHYTIKRIEIRQSPTSA